MQRIIQHRCDSGSEFLLISDLHIDNPSADLEYIHQVMYEAKKRDAKILINGDLVCAMEGKGDRRGNKEQLRPELQGANYFDKMVNWIVEQLYPYAHNILYIGYGNHGTSVLKHQETDLIDRIVTLLNYRTGANIIRGAYATWLQMRVSRSGTNYNCFNIYAHHGWGGGGEVTKGVINNQRLDAHLSNADMTWLGHTHTSYVLEHIKEHLHVTAKKDPEIIEKTIWHVRTPSFKDEHSKGIGFHTEKGRPFKPMGGYWMKLNCKRRQRNGIESTWVHPEFTKTSR